MQAIVKLNEKKVLVDIIEEYEAEDIKFVYLKGKKKGQIEWTEEDNIIRYVEQTPKKKRVFYFKDVQFVKEYEWFMGDIKYFWRADYNRQTIAIAKTKAECMKEARFELAKMNEEENKK